MVKEYGDYHGEHSAKIGSKDTFTDWHLVPTGGYLFFTPPAVSLSILDNPGADGIIDFTEALTGKPKLGAREGQWEFAVLNGYLKWSDTYSMIMNYLHGRKFQVILADDPDYYYTARFTVDEWQSEEARSTITLKYVADPYKLDIATSVDNSKWKWDPFNFETGVILSSKCSAIDVNPDMGILPTIQLTGRDVGRKPIVPQIKYVAAPDETRALTLKFSNQELGISNVTKTIQANGTLEDLDIIMSGYSPTNQNKIVVTDGGLGTLSIIFRRGSL